MDSDEFLQAHVKWKYGTKQAKEERPQTWLMSESGLYFPLEGDLDHELERLREAGMPCTVHRNETSITMSQKQATKKGLKDESMRGLPTPLR